MRRYCDTHSRARGDKTYFKQPEGETALNNRLILERSLMITHIHSPKFKWADVWFDATATIGSMAVNSYIENKQSRERRS